MTALKTLLATVILAASAATASAQGYPEKPVKIVVAYPPGGATDVIARKLAQKLSDQTGKSFFVENKPGATGTIGTAAVANAPADGYTLLFIENTYSIYPYVFHKLPFDHAKALQPVTGVYMVPVLLAAKTDAGTGTLAEIVAKGKTAPDTITFGTGGPGSAPHFAAELFQQVASVQLRHIPYKGAGDAMAGLVGGQIDLLFVSTPSAAAQIKGGRIRALAISGDERLASLPDVPTFKEAGFGGYAGYSWTGVAAPAGTPVPVVARLQAEVATALKSADMIEFAATMSAKPGPQTPEAFARLITDDTAMWAPVAAKAQIEKQ